MMKARLGLKGMRHRWRQSSGTVDLDQIAFSVSGGLEPVLGRDPAARRFGRAAAATADQRFLGAAVASSSANHAALQGVDGGKYRTSNLSS